MKEVKEQLDRVPVDGRTNDKLNALKFLISQLEHVPSHKIEELALKYQKSFKS
ncbi:MAG: hypothetical protein WD512_04325 [Candidatus Paceibacterota bacterium]